MNTRRAPAPHDELLAELEAMQRTQKELMNAVCGMDLACSVDLLNPCWNNRPTDIVGKHWGNPTVPSCPQCAARSILAKVGVL